MWNRLSVCLMYVKRRLEKISREMLQTVECTNNIDVDLEWKYWLQCYNDTVKTSVSKINVRTANLPPGLYHLAFTLK